VISLLFQSRTNLPAKLRESLLNHYLAIVQQRYNISREVFLEYYDGLVILRMLQVLGTYGRVGLGQGKSLFIKSIPIALDTLATTINTSSVIRERFPKLVKEFSAITTAGKQCFN
jgi:aminoglycoside/choline kinase family phosphotransferase